jgi:hypothetical protein
MGWLGATVTIVKTCESPIKLRVTCSETAVASLAFDGGFGSKLAVVVMVEKVRGGLVWSY